MKFLFFCCFGKNSEPKPKPKPVKLKTIANKHSHLESESNTNKSERKDKKYCDDLLKPLVKKLKANSEMKALKIFRNTLMAGSKDDPATTQSKWQALDTLIKSLDTNDRDQFFTILTNPNDQNYKDMVQPRDNYLFNLFGKRCLNTRKKDSKNTALYKLLSNLKNSKEYKELYSEYSVQQSPGANIVREKMSQCGMTHSKVN